MEADSPDLLSPVDLRRIEEASLNAWPGLQQLVVDGWLLRFADGYSKRANSVTALYPAQGDPDDKIIKCGAHYAARGLPAIFRITPFADPSDLDVRLAERGYSRLDPTLVLGLDLGAVAMGAALLPSTLRDCSLDVWGAIYATFAGRVLPPAHGAIISRVAESGALQLTCACMELDGRPVACGIGVIEGAYVGLFGVITDPALRRRGHGRALTMRLLAWSKARGARYAYLQVQEDNAAARSLYAQLGFELLYRYWYRLRLGPGG